MIKKLAYKQRKQMWICLLILSGVILLAAGFELMCGNTFYTPAEVIDALIHQDNFTIVQLRLPRLLVGILCGFAFGMAGHSFQTLFRNPLASPDIIGVNSGAAVFAMFGLLILHWSGISISILSVIGALLISFLINLFARNTSSRLTKMILIGLGIQAFLQALFSYMILKAAPNDLSNAMRWLSGSLNHSSMDEVFRLLPIVVIFGVILTLIQPHVQILKLSKEMAVSLGVNVKRTQIIVFICAVFLAAVAASTTGPIASVAFLSGPIAQKISRYNQNSLLIAGLVGSLIVLLADCISQNVLPIRYPVGVVTGVLGAPYLIYTLLRLNKKGGRG